MRRRKRKSSKIKVRRLSFGGWVWIIIIMVAIIKLIDTECTIRRLRKEGVCAIATVYAEGYRFARFYEFKVGNTCYTGKAASGAYLEIGDTLTIVYLPSDPEISQPNSVIGLNCNNN